MPMIIDVLRQPQSYYVPANAYRDLYGLDMTMTMMQRIVDDVVDRVPVFQIDNVAAYAFEHSDAGILQWFSDLTPPFRQWWMEYYIPEGELINSKVGILFEARELDDHPDYRWYIDVLEFSWFPERPNVVCGPTFSGSLGIGHDGSLKTGLMLHRPEDKSKDSPEVQAMMAVNDQFSWSVQPCLLALTFLHCKNVVVTEEAGQYANRQERRAAQRRNDPPLVKVKTLHIEPMKTIIRRESGGEPATMKKSLHIVRSYIAEYGDDYGKGKLFGKYEGRFFIPAHVRGSAEQGIIDKRYVVHPPKDEGEAA